MTTKSNIPEKDQRAILICLALATGFAISSYLLSVPTIITYSFGFASFLIWIILRKKYPRNPMLKWIPYILAAGFLRFIIAIAKLVYLIIKESNLSF
ncbi:MAG: hypothetical protein GC181_10525 [Bacteroidetes bacterium]|nr:hypothetical protein [Bacteroidota bacterium]